MCDAGWSRRERGRIRPRQIESNESSPCFRNSEDANNVEASSPPLRAGCKQEMEVRVDCGHADPRCVSAPLLVMTHFDGHLKTGDTCPDGVRLNGQALEAQVH